MKVLFISPLTLATNDWSTPCLRGHCTYDFLPDSMTMARTLMIVGYVVLSPSCILHSFPKSGASDAISDITQAAGWVILDCLEKTDSSHTIRLRCDGSEELCGHLLQGHLENKVVRLPEEVGLVIQSEMY